MQNEDIVQRLRIDIEFAGVFPDVETAEMMLRKVLEQIPGTEIGAVKKLGPGMKEVKTEKRYGGEFEFIEGAAPVERQMGAYEQMVEERARRDEERARREREWYQARSERPSRPYSAYQRRLEQAKPRRTSAKMAIDTYL